MAFFILIFGGLFYLCFRPPTILLFYWLDYIGFDYTIFQNINMKLPLLISSYLPNILFVVFGCIVIYIIWDKKRFYYILYISIFLAMTITYEIITQDISDIIAVITIYFFALLIYIRLIGVKHER